MSTGAGDGTAWEVAQSIANNEAFYLQGLSAQGVDDIVAFSPVVFNALNGNVPCTMGVYQYSTIKPYTAGQGNIGGSAPLQARCHYYQRMWVIGGRDDDMQNIILPQLMQVIDIYANFVTAHQTMREPRWDANHKILPGVIVVPTASNGHAYQNKTGATFTTGSVEPTWPTGSGSTVADGGGTWTEIRAPWGAVSNWVKLTKAEVFSINVEEELSDMGIAFSIEATTFPQVTVAA